MLISSLLLQQQEVEGTVSKLNNLIQLESITLHFITHILHSLREFPTKAKSLEMCHIINIPHAENKKGIGGWIQKTENVQTFTEGRG